MKHLRALVFASLAALLCAPAVADTTDARVIVKFRDGSALKQIQAASQIQAIGERLGLTARLTGQPSGRQHVMQARGIGSEALAARLALEADVEYAVPDRVKHSAALPNDPLFQNQWYLQAASASQAAAIDALGAWNTTTGSASVIVAVVDTGVRFDHPDLAGRLLTGYDFVSDDANSGDGQAGRDADASDPGDYVSTSDLSNSALITLCPGLTLHNSSWHGTQVAGIVAADSNNSIGIAGVASSTRILPVRALGKCGGFDSDIIAGMRWAAGLTVPGVASNPNPARIINLSLAGAGSCSAAYLDAITEIRAAGTLVVAAAGNAHTAVEEPANCAGVLAVAGVRHVGSKVGYSSFGPEVGISAPAGNCVNTASASPCLFPFINLTNLGTSIPASNGYTGTNDITVGTSFSTPLVAGTAALMLAANPGLGVADLTNRIKQSANAFPVDAALLSCAASTTDQCNCTTATCGAGLLNTAAAVLQAQQPVAAIAVPASAVAGTAFTLGDASSVGGGAHFISWQWTQVAGSAGSFGSPNAASTSFTAPLAGTYTIALAVTDSAGHSATAQTSINVQAAPAPAPDSGSSGGGGALDLPSLIGLAAFAALASRRRSGKT